MTTALSPTQAEWLERAKSLAPIVEQYADEGEQQRRLPTPIFEAIREAGLFRTWVPRAFGGPEVDLVTFQQITEEVAYLDGAVGWNMMIGAECGAIFALLPAEVAGPIYEEGSLGAGSTNPAGRAEVVPGGYRLSGQWPLASGCHQAGWMLAMARIIESGEPRLGPSGSPELRMLTFRVEDCEILDTWYSSGLRGTGSHDFAVKALFVPEAYAFSPMDLPANPPGPLYRGMLPFLLGAPLASVALGIARAAIDCFAQLARDKTPARGVNKLAERQINHWRVGQAQALVRSARCFLHDTSEEYMRGLEQGPVLPNDERTMLLRLAGANAAQKAVEAVDLIYTASGTSAVYAGNKIERCARDVRMITQHVGVAASTFEIVGAHYLGIENATGR